MDMFANIKKTLGLVVRVGGHPGALARCKYYSFHESGLTKKKIPPREAVE